MVNQQSVADPAGQGLLPVRPHLRPRPPDLRCSDPRLEIAIEFERLPDGEDDGHGWRWRPSIGFPAIEAMRLPFMGQA